MKNRQKQFEKLYDKKVEQIYRYVFLKVGSAETAEDITSQVFMKGWKKVRTGVRLDNANAYLFQIAKTEVADFYRKRAKFKIVSVSTNGVDLASSLSNPEEEQVIKQEVRRAQDLLNTLKDDYQDVLILRYIDGYDVAEIALMLNKTEPNVRVMLHRALKELREKMGRGEVTKQVSR